MNQIESVIILSREQLINGDLIEITATITQENYLVLRKIKNMTNVLDRKIINVDLLFKLDDLTIDGLEKLIK